MSLCFLSLDSSKIFNELILEALVEAGFDGLSETLIRLFPYIEAAQKIRTTQLSNKVGYSRQAMHKNVKKLESLGYITLTQENQKEKSISLSPKGEKLMLVASKQIQEIEEKISAFVGEDELEIYKNNQLKVHNCLESLKSPS